MCGYVVVLENVLWNMDNVISSIRYYVMKWECVVMWL